MADLVDLYAEELVQRGSKGSSLRVTKSILRTVASDCGPLDRLTSDQVTEWLDSRRTHDGGSIGASTRWNYISGLNRFYSWAMASGHLSTNPVAGMSKPPIENVESRTISYEELQRAITMATDNELRCALILAAYQGLRPQDVAMLEWSDIDLSADPPVLTLGREGSGPTTIELNSRTMDALEDLPGPREGRVISTPSTGALGTRINRFLEGLDLIARADNLRSWFKSDEYWKHELTMSEAPALRSEVPLSPEVDQTIKALMAYLRIPALRPELEDRVHLPLTWLQELLDGLTDKKQVIFYGPPGTGKTYVALALAEEITRDGGEIQLVQFHPSYSYEDFVGGFRPLIDDGGNGVRYDRVDGPLRRVAALAEQNAGLPYVLIVDEINRGNIPKIFGELLFLLEYRTKAARLQYWPEAEFALPKNLFIIGTMNTADRSIALVDLALRRRFLFFEFSPVEEPVSEVLSRWLMKCGLDDLPARLLKQLNSELSDDGVSIGPSYFMSDPQSGPPLERIWLREILPLLDEYKFGTKWDRQYFGLKQMLARVPRDQGSTSPVGSEPSSE